MVERIPFHDIFKGYCYDEYVAYGQYHNRFTHWYELQLIHFAGNSSHRDHNIPWNLDKHVDHFAW